MEIDVGFDAGRMDHRRDRQDDDGGEEALGAAREHFGESDEPDGARCLDPVLDFTGEPELLRQRHGDGLNTLEHDGESDHPRDEDGRKGGLGPGDARSADPLSDFGKHIEKDEAEEEWLHQGADGEFHQVLAQDQQVALDQGTERRPTGGSGGTGGCSRHPP